MIQMAMVPIFAKRREVPPTLLDRAIGFKIRHEQEEELLHVAGQPRQASSDLLLESDLIRRHGYNITTRRMPRKEKS